MDDIASRLAVRFAGLLANRLQVVIYHRVVDRTDPMLPTLPTIEEFSREISWLKDSFNIMPLHEAVERLVDGRLPRRSLCITFDDGYKDNLINAVPILREHRVSATFFITTAYMNGDLMWNDRVIEAVRASQGEYLDLRAHKLARYELNEPLWAVGDKVLDDLKYFDFETRDTVSTNIFEASNSACAALMMNAEDILKMNDAGMEIGGHTHSHPILRQLSERDAFQEIKTNKDLLEGVIGKPVTSFAYPNGLPGTDYDRSHIRMLKELNYKCGVSTARGAASESDDPFQIPRFTPWGTTRLKYNLAMVRNNFRKPLVVD